MLKNRERKRVIRGARERLKTPELFTKKTKPLEVYPKGFELN